MQQATTRNTAGIVAGTLLLMASVAITMQEPNAEAASGISIHERIQHQDGD